MTRAAAAVKRAFDVSAASAGLLLLSPLLAAIALAVKLDSRGPVLHRGARVGRQGRPFRIFKFRTMVAEAAAQGPAITAAGDPRVTRVGRWLRRTKLDELPQLFNVVRGEMSLVGPRPEDPRYVALYTPEQRRILTVRPGITGAASLAHRDEEALLAGPEWEARYRTEIMPRKLATDLAYMEQASFASDLRLIFRTLGALARRR